MEFLEFTVSEYGVGFETAPLYIFINWTGLALAVAIVAGLKLRGVIKARRKK
jgi:hypothetical protein